MKRYKCSYFKCNNDGFLYSINPMPLNVSSDFNSVKKNLEQYLKQDKNISYLNEDNVEQISIVEFDKHSKNHTVKVVETFNIKNN